MVLFAVCLSKKDRKGWLTVPLIRYGLLELSGVNRMRVLFAVQ